MLSCLRDASSLLVAVMLVSACACCVSAPAPPRSLHFPPETPPSSFLSSANSSSVVNVQSFGASGDGTTDDTAAFTHALSFLLSRPHGGVLYVPAGAYLITSTIAVPSTDAFTLQGDGWVSSIIWNTPSHLFQWPSSGPASNILIQDIKVSVPSSWGPSSVPLFAFSFPAGLTQSLIRHIKVDNPSYKGYGVSGIDMGLVSDTNEVVSCVLWLLTGTGIRIGKGSEIRVSGGRVISLGALQSPAGSIGVHVTGNNGPFLFRLRNCTPPPSQHEAATNRLARTQTTYDRQQPHMP
jgi:hypothetical protein